jgi:hypothetical protein
MEAEEPVGGHPAGKWARCFPDTVLPVGYTATTMVMKQQNNKTTDPLEVQVSDLDLTTPPPTRQTRRPICEEVLLPLCDVTMPPRSPLKVTRRFGRTCRLRLRRRSKATNKPADTVLSLLVCPSTYLRLRLSTSFLLLLRFSFCL